MSILSDKEIIELAKNQGMISPFEEKQVKINENGEKIVSYGTSSYGYYPRVTNEFKIFTNIN